MEPKFNGAFLLLVIVICYINNGVLSSPSPQYTNEAFHQQHMLGPEGIYTLEWQVDWETKSITFNVSAECKGYIGMGLSKTGSIAGSDFVIGGIDSTGKSYFSDMHGMADGTVQKDSRSDWKLLTAHREQGRIYLSFSRPFETCDEEDYAISENLVHVIWAYGDTDEITLFSPHHGHQAFYLLDPDLTTEISHNLYRQIGPHSNIYLVQRWNAATNQRISANVESQMCSIVKGPEIISQHYISGGGAYLPFKESQKHVRQIILSRCVPPEGTNATAFFDPLAKREGQDCNSFQNSSSIPKHLCTETVFVSGYGGKPFYFPQQYGIGISQNEYFMLEIHYHNPENLRNVHVKAGLELMYDPFPRVSEAGIQKIGYGQGLLPIPSHSTDFSIFGHCSSQCTKTNFPKEGLDVIAASLQMRGLGKSIRLRHFRGTMELPWILNDDNYESNYQQTRLLQKFVTVLPGDQITLQCNYGAASNATFSGFANDKELCMAYLIVNQRVSTAWCSSENAVGTQPSPGNVSSKRSLMASSTMEVKNSRWSLSSRAARQGEILPEQGLQTSSCPSHNQLAKSSNTRTNILNRGRKRQTGAAVVASFTTSSFAAGSVTVPDFPFEYSPTPTSNCPLKSSNGPVNNVGNNRNVATGNLKSQVSLPDDKKIIPTISSDRFRRVG